MTCHFLRPKIQDGIGQNFNQMDRYRATCKVKTERISEKLLLLKLMLDQTVVKNKRIHVCLS